MKLLILIKCQCHNLLGDAIILLDGNIFRSEDVTGHVTALAINSVHKFLSYDLIDVTKPGVRVAVENLADAVTHARCV